MTIQDLHERQLIVYKCISGSKAYGLALPGSDTDIKGVFVLPQNYIYGFSYIPQIADASNDEVYYELGRFLELLGKNNPNILELLATPSDKILLKHPIMEAIAPRLFLSKKCKDTFAGYAFSQIKKAKGLNKKINNPIAKKRKNLLDFCYVLHGKGSMPLNTWLQQQKYAQANCGLVKVPHAKNVFAIYYDPTNTLAYKGIVQKDNATMVALSSIPKTASLAAYVYVNQDGYSKYCKDYKAYWQWVEKRNEMRYTNTIAHGKNYDSKNMMHTFRLLDMAAEILSTGIVQVKRPNRDFLLSIRMGEWQYADLMALAQQKMTAIELAYTTSLLPDMPNMRLIEQLLVDLRRAYYAIND